MQGSSRNRDQKEIDVTVTLPTPATAVRPRSARSLAQATAQQIKALIVGGGMQPGDPLPSENELCEQLGVSRSSVREAIRTLTTLEIVDVQHGRGTFVGTMSLQPLVETLAFRSVLSPGDDFEALREVVDVRVSLDLGLAEKVVAHFEGRRDEELHAIVERMIDLTRRGLPFPEEDRAFHALLMARTGLEMVAQLVTAFWDIHTLVLPQLSIPTPDDIELTVAAHLHMLEAAERGDLDGYREAVREHYEPLRRALESRAR